MITLLKNAKVIDPANHKDGVVQDIYIRDGRIIAKPADSEKNRPGARPQWQDRDGWRH